MLDDDNKTITTVAWSEICPWLIIFRTFRLATGLRTMFLGAVASLLTLSGWALLGHAFYNDDDIPGWMSPKEGCPWTAIDEAVEDMPRVPNEGDFQETFLRAPGDGSVPGNPVCGTWTQLSRPLLGIFRRDVTSTDFLCMGLCGLWSLAIWAFFGAVITRTAAVRLAVDEQIGLGAALRFARSKWISYVGGPLFLMTVILAAAFLIWTASWITRLGGVGVWFMAVFWPLALLLGLGMMVLMLGLLFGWPLMWSTISTEGRDTFDALQRAFDYVRRRPLHYLFYASVAAALGGLGWLLVKNVAAGVVGMSYWAAAWVAGWDVVAGNGLIHFWCVCIKLLAVGYIYGYFWTASVAVYLLLRHDADGTEMDEVFLDDDADEQAFGLPSITTDAAGAPIVDDDIPEVEPDDEPTSEETE